MERRAAGQSHSQCVLMNEERCAVYGQSRAVTVTSWSHSQCVLMHEERCAAGSHGDELVYGQCGRSMVSVCCVAKATATPAAPLQRLFPNGSTPTALS
jgi:hypothetical protein